MKKSIYFSLLVSTLFVLQGCGEYNPEVNEANCAIPKEETKKKFKNLDNWREFNSACMRIGLKEKIAKMEKELRENIAKEKALRESRQKESGYNTPSAE